MSSAATRASNQGVVEWSTTVADLHRQEYSESQGNNRMVQRRLGEILKTARERRGLSLYALAEKSGVDRGLLWRIEQGQVNNPKAENLSRIAEALGLSLTDVYAKAGYPATTRLPSLPVYLRTKYGHLPPEKQEEVVEFFKQIEAEHRSDRSSKKGAKNGNDK
jgi:transcriptional regulator with XRE-family HTH domain